MLVEDLLDGGKAQADAKSLGGEQRLADLVSERSSGMPGPLSAQAISMPRFAMAVEITILGSEVVNLLGSSPLPTMASDALVRKLTITRYMREGSKRAVMPASPGSNSTLTIGGSFCACSFTTSLSHLSTSTVSTCRARVRVKSRSSLMMLSQRTIPLPMRASWRLDFRRPDLELAVNKVGGRANGVERIADLMRDGGRKLAELGKLALPDVFLLRVLQLLHLCGKLLVEPGNVLVHGLQTCGKG